MHPQFTGVVGKTNSVIENENGTFLGVPLLEILSIAHAFFFMSQSAMSTAAIASAASRTGIDEP